MEVLIDGGEDPVIGIVGQNGDRNGDLVEARGVDSEEENDWLTLYVLSFEDWMVDVSDD